MLYKSFTTKKSIRVAVVLFALAGIMHQILQEPSNGLTSFMSFLVDMIYMGIVIFWMGSIRRRLTHKYIKSMLLAIGSLVIVSVNGYVY